VMINKNAHMVTLSSIKVISVLTLSKWNYIHKCCK
jgi:hypothetical protein